MYWALILSLHRTEQVLTMIEVNQSGQQAEWMEAGRPGLINQIVFSVQCTLFLFQNGVQTYTNGVQINGGQKQLEFFL